MEEPRRTMAATDFFAGEIVTELLKKLLLISRKSARCKSTAENLISHLQQLLPIIKEIKYTGVGICTVRQDQLDRFSELLGLGLQLATKALNSARWNFYKNVTYARDLERFEKIVAGFMQGPLQAHLLADLRHLVFDTAKILHCLDQYNHQIETWLCSPKDGFGGEPCLMEEALRRAEEEDQFIDVEGSLVNLSLESGKKEVKEMVIGRDDLTVVGICGIAGSGKTTLARVLCRDDEIKSHFNDRFLFLTASQSRNVEQLRSRIWRFLMGNDNLGPGYVIPESNLQFPLMNTSVRALIVLDDVWSLRVLKKLIFKIPGCKTLVVSRFKFPTVLDATYEVEQLREDDALALLCHSAFGQKSMPPNANQILIKQIVNECKGFPLALNVIGASLRDQSEKYWASAENWLSCGGKIRESHQNNLLDLMAICVNCLSDKVRECFLDMGAFPEDKKIPLDLLINVWVELHDIDEQEAFAILFELANKNLLNLVKVARDGDVDPNSCDVAVTQRDVLRHLALQLSDHGNLSERKRLLMPRIEMKLPEEWERNSDQPFNAQVVSIHTGEMDEMDWFQMEFPKAEVLILNFSSKEYFLPPIIEYMPNLRALIIINYHSASASLHNFPELSILANLRNLWLENVSVPQSSSSTVLFSSLIRLSLVRGKINNNFNEAGLASASASTSVVPWIDTRFGLSHDRISISSDRFSAYTDDIED